MADARTQWRGPGARPWVIGILVLAAVAALAFWLLDSRAEDRALEGVSGTVQEQAPPPLS